MSASVTKKCRTLRDWILDIHAWMGALAALFILLTSVTGGALLFSGPIMKAETGALSVTGERKAPVDLAALIKQAQSVAGETFLPVGYLGPNAEIVTDADMIYGMSDLPENGGEVQIISFDPATGEATGSFYLDRTFTHKLIDFHYELLAGQFGAFLIAVIGLLMAILAIMGLILWWPGRGRLIEKATKTSLKGPLFAKSFRLHSLSGFWLSLAVLLWGLSGTYWSKPHWFPKGLTPQTDRLAQALPESFLSQSCNSVISIGEAVKTALSQNPNHYIFEAEFAAPWQNYHTLYLGNGRDLHKMDADKRVWVHAQCPNLNLEETLSGFGAVGAAAEGLHSGRMFGFLRIPVILIISFALILMSITGLHLWWSRIFRRQGAYQ